MQLLVMGMHRSGTSALTRLLNMLGAYVASDGATTGASTENPKGFWERRDVRAANDLLINSAGSTWDDIRDFTPDGISDEVKRAFEKQARNIVLDLDGHRPWVMKEPRLCETLPAWIPFLEVPIAIFVYRHPVEVALSLKKRNGLSMAVAIALWEKYNLDALAATAAMPRLLVSHNEIISSPMEVTRRLLSQLEALGVRRLSMPTEREVSAFIAPELRHHASNSDALLDHLNGSQQRLFQAFANGSVFALSPPPGLSAGADEVLTDHHTERAKQIAHEQTERLIKKLEERNEVLSRRLADLGGRLSDHEARLAEAEARTQELVLERDKWQGERKQWHSERKRWDETWDARSAVWGRALRQRDQLLKDTNKVITRLESRVEGLLESETWRALDRGNRLWRKATRKSDMTRADRIRESFAEYHRLLDERSAALEHPTTLKRAKEEQPVSGPANGAPIGLATTIVRTFQRKLAKEWWREHEQLERDARVSSQQQKKLKVLVGTMSAAENELEQCKDAITRQKYPHEHVLIAGLCEKEATQALMDRFTASDADVLIKVDADMVLLDTSFISRVVEIFAHGNDIDLLQMAILDYFSGDLIQGINAYRRNFGWNASAQDALFTDRTEVAHERRLVTWTTFADAAIHCPDPSPFQAFHFGVHRGMKVVQPNANKFSVDRAEEQATYLEKTWQHFELRRDPRLGLACVGYELALTEPFTIEQLAYSNPFLEERFRPYEGWDAARLRDEVLRLRQRPALTPEVDAVRRAQESLARRELEPVRSILVLLPHLDVYGGINRFLDLAGPFTKLGVRYVVAVMDGEQSGRALPPHVEALGLAEALEQSWDVVLCGDASSGIMMTSPLFKSRLNAVYLLNGSSYGLLNRRQIGTALPDVVVASSTYAARCYRDLAPTVVAGGVDLHTFFPAPGVHPRDRDRFRVACYPGRRKPVKRFEDIVAACRLLHERGVPVELHVYDQEDFTLQERFPFVHHGALERVRVRELMWQSDVVVMAEVSAGWSNPAAEAMASGTPLVCTEAGTLDFAIDGETAFVVPMRDPKAIADAVQKYYAHPEVAARHREAGLAKIRQFAWTEVARRLLDVFRAARKDTAKRGAANARALKRIRTLGLI